MGALLAKVGRNTQRPPLKNIHTYLPAPHSLQLNIGIIAACASFLKPLVGRLLKINSSVGYSYPSTPYGRSGGGRSGRTPMGVETIGSKYPHRRRAADESHADEFEMHTKSGGSPTGESRVVTSVEGAPSSRRHSPDYSAENVAPDNNSEEIILQKQDTAHGIMMTRDVSVRYSNKG